MPYLKLFRFSSKAWRLLKKTLKILIHFQQKNTLLVRWKDVCKKNLENFPIFCPIWNLSDLQYFSVFHHKRVRRPFKKNLKSLIYFQQKTSFWCCGKTPIRKTLGLRKTFRTCNIYPPPPEQTLLPPSDWQ